MAIASGSRVNDGHKYWTVMDSLARTSILLLISSLIVLSSCSTEDAIVPTAESQGSNEATPTGSLTTPLINEESQPAVGEYQVSPSATVEKKVTAGVASEVVPTDDQSVQPTTQDLDATATQTIPTLAPTETPLPPSAPVMSISFRLVTEGFERPTYLTHANDNRLFVTEQAGRIWTIVDGQKSTEPFLDIRERVGSDSLEQGLLSVAFHPDYSTNRYFYVNYTDRAGDTVIARFELTQSDPNKADEGSERVILTINQPYVNHNGGQIQFGPDGYLYIGMGDGGSAGDPGNNGQNPATLLGSLLRIDVNSSEPYSIPSDNPFTTDESARDETWATGLRNPWRFSFDRLTGDSYIADVGQNQWEEINFQSFMAPGGANYGWRELEGTHCYAVESCDTTRFDLPVAEYSHTEGGCSITGGYIYRGTTSPSLWGNYFFGDYCSGFVWSLFRSPDGSWQRTQVAQLRANIASFGEDVAGELYVLDHFSGAVYHIQP
jgi:glucose/arabinose dehydrogenase